MKNLLLSAAASLLVSLAVTAQNVPSYVPANGLVGWWPFNGNANDESGNGNHGTVNGATLTMDRFGNQNKAFLFNGTTDKIQIQDANILDLANNYTLSAWYLTNSSTQVNQAILGKGGLTGGTGYQLMVNTNTPIKALAFGFNNSTGINGGAGTPTTTANLTGWHLLTGTYDGISAKLYLDGVLMNSVSISYSLPNSNQPLLFGNETNSLTRFFNGKLDDIAIYNRSLTQQEITGLYQGGNTTANCPTFPASLAQGLVGYWPFCGNALDESGNDNHGTVNGASLTTDRFGNAGSAYSFDGVNDRIEITANNTINRLQNVSVGFWINVNSLPQSTVTNKIAGAITKWYGSGNCNSNTDHFGTWISSDSTFLGGTRLYSQTSDMTSSNSIITPNTWYHVVFIHDSAVGGKLFVNKTLVSEIPISGALCETTNNLYFGCDNGLGVLNRFLNGSLDDIAIWNRALTQQEITQLYNQGICQTSITVTDTLLIHTGITSYNPVAYGNTLKVWPNPGNTAITLDAGNLSSMQGWKIRISNSLGQEVYPATLISQQQQVLSMSTWGGNGLYLLHLINPQGHITEVKKIVLAP